MGIWNTIKAFFNSSPIQSEMHQTVKDPNAYHFHEDFYRQIEFLPKTNFKSASKSAEDIFEHSKENFDTYGWKNIYVRKESEFPTSWLNISLMEMGEFLKENNFFECSKVTTGYSTYVEELKNTKAFKNRSIVICFDFENDVIKNIWLNEPPYLQDNSEYKNILLKLSRKYDFILADWNQSIILDIANPLEIDSYFRFVE